MYIPEKIILKNPKKAYKELSIPLIIFAIFDAFYMFIDTFWSSFIGIEGIIAVGVSVPIVSLISKFANSLGQGTNSYMSQNFGGCNPKQANNTLLHGLLIGLIISIIIPLLTIPFLEQVLDIFNYNGSIEHIVYYIIPILVGTFVFIFNGLLSESIQAEGDSKRPTTIMIIGNILNFILSPVLCLVFGLGVFGLSLATIIGQIVPLSFFIYIYMCQDKITAKISLKEFKFELGIIKDILKVTIPNFVDRSLYSFLAMYINIILTIFVGAEYIVVYTFCTNISDLLQAPARGSTKGLLTIIGHLYGGKKIDKMKELYIYSIKIGLVLSIITSIILLLIVFISPTTYEEILGLNLIYFLCVVLIIINLTMVIAKASSRTLDGLGKSIYSLIGSIINIIFCFLLITILSIAGVYLAVPIGLIIADIIATIYYIDLMRWMFKKLKTNTA